jgi:hypothetical protein
MEAPMVRLAMAKIGGPEYSPKLTIIIAQKRHNIRILPAKVTDG